jgi:succinate dehydrogenase / fumarate reductase flavoprotein subunit
MLEAKIPSGPIEEQWDKCRYEMKLVNPANRRMHSIIVVGTGLGGAAAAATLGQQGYHVQCFSYHDTPRRAHSIAAQGGINAAKNYRNDGDSILRLFKDTVKGGDFRAREANVYRLAQVSVNIIDQCVAQGVPFAREYGGLLDTRSFGGVQVQRTFYARGQTGQQLLLGAYQALEEQLAAGTVTMHIRSEVLDVVIVNGRARGIVTRNLVRGQTRTQARSESHSEVHGECDSVRRRRADRPTETDWQVCLDEVSFEQAVVMLDRPAFINQGRKSHRGVIYDERRS